MKNCVFCGAQYDCAQTWSKYCSYKCGRLFNNKKNYLIKKSKLKDDPIFFKKYKDSENARKRRKYANDPDYRERRLKKEVNRSREKAGIRSDADLKIGKKGSGCLTKYGYRKMHKPGHANAWRNGDIFEHVYIMSAHLNRALNKGETVHHKNGIRHDNRIENLELWSKSHPCGQRVEDKISWCKEFLEIYGYRVIFKINS